MEEYLIVLKKNEIEKSISPEPSWKLVNDWERDLRFALESDIPKAKSRLTQQ